MTGIMSDKGDDFFYIIGGRERLMNISFINKYNVNMS